MRLINERGTHHNAKDSARTGAAGIDPGCHYGDLHISRKRHGGQLHRWDVQLPRNHTASDPDTVVDAGPTRFCYDRMFGFYSDGVLTERFRAVLILGETGQRVMNLIPANASLNTLSGYKCIKANTSQDDILLSVPPRVN